MHVFGGRGGGKGRGGAAGPWSGPTGMMMGPTGDGLCRTAGLAFCPSCSAIEGALLFNNSAATRIRSGSLVRTLDIVAVPREAMPRSATLAATCVDIAGDIETPPPIDAAASATNSLGRFIVLRHLSFGRRHPDHIFNLQGARNRRLPQSHRFGRFWTNCGIPRAAKTDLQAIASVWAAMTRASSRVVTIEVV